jgi:hypothetical protein
MHHPAAAMMRRASHLLPHTQKKKKNRFKHQLAFYQGGCGASLIREDVAITARHCHADAGQTLVAGAVTSPFLDYVPSEGSHQAVVESVLSHPDPQV